eukprot:TRINITY_DN4733_c0_g1_i4.p1 TRINITY_DN4733_c0_g1~~TRINITY_DN4733_c0_g1_i4.p1  ORF type:complete len:150 (-),score=27.21 TRINITY_DN4733_c0_g1_i4:62-511(-)
MWLAPFTAINPRNAEMKRSKTNPYNVIHVLLDKPVGISCITLWNYSKTPARGVRELEIYLDENILYKGYLRKAPTELEFRGEGKPIATSVVFTKNEELFKRLAPKIYTEDGTKQSVMFTNERKSSVPISNVDIRQILLERPDTSVKGVK